MLCDLQIFSGKVYHPEPPHAQSLFLFPIVFGINLSLTECTSRTMGSASALPIINNDLGGRHTTKAGMTCDQHVQ